MVDTILIVEDSDDDFFAIMRIFKNGGLRNPIRRCSCGEQALDCLLQRGDADVVRKPGLILLDLNMPGMMDGRDVLRAVKTDPHLHEVPVIVLTASFAREDIARCYDAGADSYLLKPVDMDGFIKSVERLKERWHGTLHIDLA